MPEENAKERYGIRTIFSDVVAYLLAVCEEWDTIEEGLDKGYSLWVLVFMDDDNKALIDSKEDADKILEALQN